jgi:hypothetical protein
VLVVPVVDEAEALSVLVLVDVAAFWDMLDVVSCRTCNRIGLSGGSLLSYTSSTVSPRSQCRATCIL